jgi:hypothetical protein
MRKFLLPLGIAMLSSAYIARASDCSVAQPHPLTEEQTALIAGKFPQAEALYRQKSPSSRKMPN